MSDIPKDPSGTPGKDASSTDQDKNTNTDQIPSGNTPDDKVNYSTLAKSIAQEKALRVRLDAAEEKVKIAEAKTLEAEGKKDELIEQQRTQLAELRESQAQSKAEKTHATISNQVMKKALEMGCVDSEMASSLIDFSKLDVDSVNSVGGESLAIALERLKKEKSYMFQSKKSQIVDGAPKTDVDEKVPSNLEDMTIEQKEAFLREKFS